MKPTISKAPLELDKFERLEIEPSAFGHAEHLEAAYEMVSRYDFLEACIRYSATIRSMAESAGARGKFNTTITVAFMSLVAERKYHSKSTGWEAFIASNPDLLDRDVLGDLYSKDRLYSDLARMQFLLPDGAVKAGVEGLEGHLDD